MKEIFICLIAVIITATMSVMARGNGIERMNLQKAVEMVLVENLELKTAEYNFQKARLEYKKAMADNLTEQSKYNELEAEYDLEEAEKAYTDTRDSVIGTTIQQYIDVWLNKLNIKVNEKTVAAEKRLLEQYQAQHEIGDISSIDLLEQRNTYNDACFELEKIKDEYTQSLRQLKMTLDLEGDEFEIDSLKEPDVWDINEETAIETALENSLELQLSTKEEQLAEIDEKRARISSSALDIKIKELAASISSLETESIKDELTISTQETYYEFKQAVKSIDLKKERLSKDRDEYELIKKQYQAGISTKTDLLQYEASLLETEYNYQEAIANYYLAEHNLCKALGLETGVFTDEILENE
ncbi:TolC family protein [Halocella sp. SP3-1]|uniref:TolC family protein n=1 Tax=Halocella sp. SP3-1 TaxID=2382161 RepID=UPI000F760B27|nr:TolC family protein [Halocella sp. SP3-1]AZO95877.1 TolC family protein [Halocella sp. SP3-1]